MTVLVAPAALVAGCLSLLRWLRVAQREHYHPGSVSRFAGRWWRLAPWNVVIGVIVVAGAALSILGGVTGTVGGLAAVAGLAVGPLGLPLRGRTGPLVWTPRMVRVAVVAALPAAAGVSWAVAAGSFAPAVWAAVLVFVWVDLALVVLGPVERRLADRWVRTAAARLASSGTRVVAVTGSYGKTSTKGYIAHLLAPVARAIASPASFNNRMGLARAVNEHLTGDVEVFVAEMGTYGPGEIAELCSWIPPDVAVITALGPVHLERMGSEEVIASAKREILERAATGVVNVDHPLLAQIAAEEASRIRVIRCSATDAGADVFADPASGEVIVDGSKAGRFDPNAAHAAGVACALGAVIALGWEPSAVSDRLTSLPTAPHRQAVGLSERGVVVIDDTYNANPAGARAALRTLSRQAGEGGRRVVVTPGMVELGSRQAAENRSFAREASRVATDLVVVGRTNRRPLLEGAAGMDPGSVIVVRSRDAGVGWVRENLGRGDAVLYENDLPDHYP